MIQPLRAAHRWIFIILAVAIVTALVISLTTRPDYPRDTIPDSLTQQSLTADSTADITVPTEPID